MKNSPVARLCFLAGGAWLIISGIGELTTTSEGNRYGNWIEETSLLALNMRSQGSLKLGLGLGMLGAASSGISMSKQDSSTKLQETKASNGSSDGSKESDFNACVELYRTKGGKEEAVMANTFTDGKTLSLVNQMEERLANFYKLETGKWHMINLLK